MPAETTNGIHAVTTRTSTNGTNTNGTNTNGTNTNGISGNGANSNGNGVIHDIGYQRYRGNRLGRAYAIRSLYTHGIRAAFGLGRSGKAKIFPWIVVGISVTVAVVVTTVRALFGEVAMNYWDFPDKMAWLIIFFCAIVAPELVSRDVRSGVLPLYFSRQLTRADYALTKAAALATAVFLLLAGPQLVMLAGGVFTVEGFDAVLDEVVAFGKGMSVAAVWAALFAALSILVASLSARRAVSAALVVSAFLITTPIWAVLTGIAYGTAPGGVLSGDSLLLARLAPLISPMYLGAGVTHWWYPPDPEFAADLAPLYGGPHGPLYGAVTLGLIVTSLLLLLLRYRKVAR